MIIGNEAVNIGNFLFSQHLNRLMSADDVNPSHLSPESANNTQAHGGFLPLPAVVYDQGRITRLKENLREDSIPLGQLGVMNQEMWLAKNINEKCIEEQHLQAMKYIKETSPWMFEVFQSLTRVFVPIGCPKGYAKAGFSSNLAKGFVFYWYPDEYQEERVFEMAIDYVHEASHQLTFLLNGIDPLIKGDDKEPVYSAIKGCERPAILALHGAIALSYMCLFRVFHRKVSGEYLFRSQKKLKEERQKLSETIRRLQETCEFTEVGTRIMKDLEFVFKKVS